MGKNILFFIGSGFSKTLADIPIQENFLKGVLNSTRSRWVFSPFDKKKDKDEKKILKKCNNIEFLISYVFHQDNLHREKTIKYKKVIINFRMALNDFLSRKHNKIKKKYSDIFRELIEKLRITNNVDIITTNYDLVLETVLGGSDNVDYCISKNLCEDKIKLIKLHGSINWLEKRKQKNKELIKGIYSCRLNEHIKKNLSKNLFEILSNKKLNIDPDNTVYYKHNNDIYTPITIPFFFQKYEWYSKRWKPIFKKLWNNAKKRVLEITDYIFFIGYSFPNADYTILSLLNDSKLFERNIPIIVIDRSCENFYKVGIKPTFCIPMWLQDFKNKNELYQKINKIIT